MHRYAPDDTAGFKTSSVWHRQLEGSETVERIVATLQDYLDTLTPEDLARLPENCRAVRIKGDDDLEYWTYKLSRHHPAHTGAWVDSALLQEVFFPLPACFGACLADPSGEGEGGGFADALSVRWWCRERE